MIIIIIITIIIIIIIIIIKQEKLNMLSAFNTLLGSPLQKLLLLEGKSY